jgi:hypothetical protein
MPQAGRPERPLDTTEGPLAELAAELRRLRGTTPYREIEARTSFSAATLQAAAAGKKLPTWPVTEAFAAACGGSDSTLRELWEDARAATGQAVPAGDRPADPTMPAPGMVETPAEFLDLMKSLRTWAGVSLGELNRRSGGYLLPPSTVSDVLRRQKLPRLSLVLDYVRACGLDEAQVAVWEQAWELLRAREVRLEQPRPADFPQSQPSVAARPPRRRGAGRDLLVWISGARPEILKYSPTDRGTYTGLGGTILLASVLAALMMAFALHMAAAVAAPAAIMLGGIWGVAILVLDRALVTSIARGPARRTLLVIVPRLLFALLLALAMATPAVMLVFAPEISSQTVLLSETEAEHFNAALARGPLAQQVRGLQAEQTRDQEQEQEQFRQWQCQLYGGSGCQQRGNGPLAQAAQLAYRADVEAVESTTRQLDAARSQETSLLQTFALTNGHRAGLLIRLDALEQVADGSGVVTATWILLILLFAVLSSTPIIVRVVLLFGPKNTYEKILRIQELAYIRAASQQVTKQASADTTRELTSDGSQRSAVGPGKPRHTARPAS